MKCPTVSLDITLSLLENLKLEIDSRGVDASRPGCDILRDRLLLLCTSASSKKKIKIRTVRIQTGQKTTKKQLRGNLIQYRFP